MTFFGSLGWVKEALAKTGNSCRELKFEKL